MPIPQSELFDGEEVVVEVRQHWSKIIGPISSATLVVAIVTTVGVLVAPAPVWLIWVAVAIVLLPVLRAAIAFFRWSRYSVALTTDRLIVRSGTFGREQGQVRLDRIADLHYAQTLFDRLLGRGAVTIERVDDTPAVFSYVRRPKAFVHVVTAELMVRSGQVDGEAEVTSGLAELQTGRPVPIDVNPDLYDQDDRSVDPVPAGVPPRIGERLEELLEQFREGDISAAEYEEARHEVLQRWTIDRDSNG